MSECTAPIGSMDGSIVVESGSGDYADFTTLQVKKHKVQVSKFPSKAQFVIFAIVFHNSENAVLAQQSSTANVNMPEKEK